MEFDPPIHTRTKEELVAIAYFPDEWNPQAVDQANKELSKREVSVEEQKKIEIQLKKEIKAANSQLANQRRKESYSYFDMFLMFLYLPRTIIWDWYLKKEGYHTQHKQRLYVIGFGILFWVVTASVISIMPDRQGRLWQNEVNRVDIYEWELDNYSNEEISEFRRESIEQVIQTVKENHIEEIPTYVILDSDTIPNSEVEKLRKLPPLTIRSVIFEGDFEPELHEWITIKRVKKSG